MLFYEPLFLFGFFPSVFAVFLLLRRFAKGTLTWLALASAAFYFWAEPKFFFIALASAALDFHLGNRITQNSRWPLYIGVSANILVLVVFKYSAFLIGQIVDPSISVLGLPEIPVPQLLLPIGVSFIVFEKITYLVDIHRGITRPAASFRDYLLFVFFFPKLLAGPIIKYHDIEPQIRHPAGVDAALIAAGFERFAIGVCKKVLIANPAGEIANQIFALPIGQLSAPDAWTGALMFTVQIYFDFSGYSDMAIGIAMMLGFRLRENFNFPYVSVGITEFWRRWHISLSSWIREYLYIPMGGSRISTNRTYFNLVVAFTASGLWHGADWRFLTWGAFHGLFLVAERAFLGKLLRALPVFVGVLVTFAIVVHGWVIFRATDLPHAINFIHRMYQWDHLDRWVYVPIPVAIACSVALVLSITARSWEQKAQSAADRAPLLVRLMLGILFLASLGQVLTRPFQPFLYFRF